MDIWEQMKKNALKQTRDFVNLNKSKSGIELLKLKWIRDLTAQDAEN